MNKRMTTNEIYRSLRRAEHALLIRRAAEIWRTGRISLRVPVRFRPSDKLSTKP